MLFSALMLCAFVALTPQQRMADRIVAVVNGEPILLSELRLSLPARLGDEELPRLMRTNLEAQIDQTLILQEVRRLRILGVEQADIDAALGELRGLYADAQAFGAALDEQGLTEQSLRRLLHRRLLVLQFVNSRFRRNIEIDGEQLMEFYKGEWADSYRERFGDRPMPTFEEVRRELEALLREREVNTELYAWLEQARKDSQIIILY